MASAAFYDVKKNDEYLFNFMYMNVLQLYIIQSLDHRSKNGTGERT